MNLLDILFKPWTKPNVPGRVHLMDDGNFQRSTPRKPAKAKIAPTPKSKTAIKGEKAATLIELLAGDYVTINYLQKNTGFSVNTIRALLFDLDCAGSVEKITVAGQGNVRWRKYRLSREVAE